MIRGWNVTEHKFTETVATVFFKFWIIIGFLFCMMLLSLTLMLYRWWNKLGSYIYGILQE